jgi:hypothetical protein
MWPKTKFSGYNNETQQNNPKMLHIAKDNKKRYTTKIQKIWPKVKLTKWLWQWNITQTTQKITCCVFQNGNRNSTKYNPQQN